MQYDLGFFFSVCKVYGNVVSGIIEGKSLGSEAVPLGLLEICR